MKSYLKTNMLAIAFGLALVALVAFDPSLASAGVMVGLGAVVNTKSNIVTNCDSTSFALSQALIKGGVLKEQAATVEVAAADDALSVYRFFRVPSNARISELLVACDAITSLSDSNWGVYQTAGNGGAVVSDNLFGDAVDLSSAIALTDITYETTPTNKSQIEKMLWELMGLTADPQREYDICMTSISDPGGAGTVSALLRYVVN